jgi:hypothetical protein
MNPGRPPERRTELRRTGGPTRRTGLRSQSDKRAGGADARAEMRELVFARDVRCRLAGWLPGGFGPCLGRLTVHHLRKAGQGGPYTLPNLLTLCAGHNDAIELHRELARELGLEIPRGGTFDEAWRQLAAVEIVDYWWTGARL